MFRRSINKIIVAVVIILTSVFIYTDGHKLQNFHGDTFGYYLYLPSAFIYNNVVKFYEIPTDKLPADAPVRWSLSQIEQNGHRTEKGIIINQYTYGIALMEAPFFLVAHAYEKARGLPANGFSDTYQIAIKVCSLFYALFGLLLVYKILRRYYSSTLSLLTAAVIFVGTNLFWFAAYHSGMSHVPLFFLYALLIYLTIKVHENPRTGYFIAIGLTAGFITIIRPTDIVCLLIPLLYNISNKETFRNKILFLKQHYKKVLIMAFVFILPAIPQMLYWKAVSGHYLYYSYGQQSFNWTKPRIFSGLIGASNGWLPYSPVMIFALLGFLCFKKNTRWTLCLWILLPVYVYIIYSWFCYNYINGLGSRPMIHLYPLLAIPLAAFFDWLSRRAVIVKGLAATIVLFFIAVNICFSYQQVRGVLWSEESNHRFNIGMLFRTKLTYNDLVVKDVGQFQPDLNSLKKVATLGVEQFEDTVSGHYYQDVSEKSKYVYHFFDEEHFDKKIRVPYNKEQFKDATWFKCSGRFLYPDWAGYFKHLMVLTIKRGNDYPMWTGCKIQNKIGIADSTCQHDLKLDHQEPNKWGNVYFFMKIPPDIRAGDTVELDLWNLGKQQLYLDDLTLEIYK